MTQWRTFPSLGFPSSASWETFCAESDAGGWWDTRSGSVSPRCWRTSSPSGTQPGERGPAQRGPRPQTCPWPTTGWRTPRQRATCCGRRWSLRTEAGSCPPSGASWSPCGSWSRWGCTERCSRRGSELGARWWRTDWPYYPSRHQSNNCKIKLITILSRKWVWISCI